MRSHLIRATIAVCVLTAGVALVSLVRISDSPGVQPRAGSQACVASSPPAPAPGLPASVSLPTPRFCELVKNAGWAA